MKGKSKASKKTHTTTASSHKNRDNLLLVSTYPPFVEKIKIIREYLGIPATGFATQEMGAIWHKQKAKESDEMTDSPEFRKKEKAVTILFKEKKISRQEANFRLKEIYAVLPFNFLTRSIKELIREFDLLESYNEALRYYIFQNDFFFIPSASYTVGPWDVKDRIAETRYVPLRVYAKLTDEDLKEMKKDVNKYFGKALPFIQKVRGVKEKLEIEKLYIGGEEYDNVSEEYYKLNSEEIAERILGDRRKKNKVYESVRSLKTLRKRRFRKAGKQ